MQPPDRALGCLLGGAVGDALGAPIEFRPLAEIRSLYGPDGLDHMVWHDSGRLGAITDDTQMTLFTMEALIRSRGIDVPPAVHAAHRRWYATQLLSGPPRKPGPAKLPTWGTVVLDGGLAQERWLYARRAPGNACMSGLRSPSMGTLANPTNPTSKGCGAVMRSAPFGLVPSWSPAEAFSTAVDCAVHTHGHPTGYLAAGVFAAIIRRLVDGLDLPEAVARTRSTIDHAPLRAALDHAVSAAHEGRPSPERIERLGAGFTADEALAIAVYCALSHPTDVRAAQLLAINHSGDSDSTGAITGNLLGAWHGRRSLPAAWVTALEGRETMQALAREFTTAFPPVR